MKKQTKKLAQLIRTLSIFLILVVYFSSVAGVSKSNSLRNSENIFVTHKHATPSHHHHGSESHHDPDSTDQPAGGHSEATKDGEETHTHIVFLALNTIHASPAASSFLALEVIESSYPRPRPALPPLAPGPGSIFRPPIS